ncbi:MAG: phycobilisome linker polypeptide [Microcoleaceae cyanobacterium MO_207.B10]|nr:phycobilisome linker polypeptide [Microcoleaceae cyanobacterium MO_207.B10]
MKTLSALGAKNKTQYPSRVFVYEVEGLRQSETTDKVNNSIRQSGTVYITVPYPRMNEEM